MIDRAGRGKIIRSQPQPVRAAAPRPGAVPRQSAPSRPALRSQTVQLRLLSGLDRAIISAGILTAVASAGFATYMVAGDRSHPVFNGAEHLMIFAQPNRGLDHAIMARVPGSQNDQGVDFTATGAIPRQSGAGPDVPYALPAVGEADGPIISGFALRGVSGNVAVVESAEGIYRVGPGTDLPGAGKVLAVQWRKGRFVVVTTRGIIAEGQP